MIQKLFKLTTIFTILSLIFIVISCNDDDNDSKKDFLEGTVNYDGSYSGTYTNKINSLTSEISFSFKKGNLLFTKFQIFKKESEAAQPINVANEDYCYQISKMYSPNPTAEDAENPYKNYYTLYVSICPKGPASRGYSPGSEGLGSHVIGNLTPYKDKDFGLTSFAWSIYDKPTDVIIYFSVSEDKNTLNFYASPLSEANLDPITLTYKQ